MRKGREGDGAHRVELFFRQIEEFENLRGSAERLDEELIDAAQALDGLVGERTEGTDGHAADFNFPASVEQDHGDDDGAEDIHNGAGGGHGADPAHIFAKQLARGFAEFANFETFHAEGFHDAIAADGFLKYLTEVGEAAAAGFGGAADAAGQFCDGPDDKRDQDRRADGHAPVNHQEHGDKYDQVENLAKEIGQVIGKGGAHLLDIGDYGGHNATDGIVVKESHGLLDALPVTAVAQVGDAGEADILDQGAAEIFGDRLDQKNEKQGEGEDGPDVVDARGDEIVQVDDASGAGNLEEHEFLQ